MECFQRRPSKDAKVLGDYDSKRIRTDGILTLQHKRRPIKDSMVCSDAIASVRKD